MSTPIDLGRETQPLPCLLGCLWLFLSVFLFFQIWTSAEEVSAQDGSAKTTSAKFERSDSEVPGLSEIASPWSIEIMLAKPMTEEIAKEERTFIVRNSETGQVVSDYRVHMASPILGKKDPVSGNSLYNEVVIYGKRISGDRSYSIEIRNAKADSEEVFEVVEVSPSKDAKDGGFFRHATENIDLQFDPKIGDDINSLGFTYDLKINIHNQDNFHFDNILSQTTVTLETYQIGARSNGQISVEDDDDNFKNSIEADLFAEYTVNPNFMLDVRDSKGNPVQRPFANPLGISFRPVGLEADRDFDRVNYAAEFAAWASVPYTWEPVLWLHELTDVKRPFVPLVLTTSYKFVQDISDDGSSNDLAETSNRMELEGLYKFPILDDLDFRAQWRGFLDLESGNFDDYVNVGLTYFPGDDRNNGITLSWQAGVLPPNFGNDDSAVLVGWSLALPGGQ